MKHVLIVEDNEMDALYFQEVLEKLGFDTTVTIELSNVLFNIKNDNAAAIILDIRMPRMTGDQYLEEIRKISMVPVVIFTAFIDENMRQKCLQLGADYYITKPVSVKDIRTIFSQYL